MGFYADVRQRTQSNRRRIENADRFRHDDNGGSRRETGWRSFWIARLQSVDQEDRQRDFLFSNRVEKKIKEAGKRPFRTVFHPDLQNSDFFGCLKPQMDGKKVRYGFSPGR